MAAFSSFCELSSLGFSFSGIVKGIAFALRGQFVSADNRSPGKSVKCLATTESNSVHIGDVRNTIYRI